MGFCVKTLEAAEEAETEGKLSQAEGLLDRVVEELRVAFQTDGHKERSASYAAAVKSPPATRMTRRRRTKRNTLPVESSSWRTRGYSWRACASSRERE